MKITKHTLELSVDELAALVKLLGALSPNSKRVLGLTEKQSDLLSNAYGSLSKSAEEATI